MLRAKVKSVAILGSTSHCKPYDSHHVGAHISLYRDWSEEELEKERSRVDELKEEVLPRVDMSTHGGLILMDRQFGWYGSLRWGPRDSNRNKQYATLLRNLKNSEAKVCLLVLGSNDFKNFFVGVKGKVCKPGKGSVKKWSKLSLQQRVNLPFRTKILFNSTAEHILKQVQTYLGKIKKIVSQCTFDVVGHGSMLERHWPGLGYENLDMLFGHINCYLRHEIKDLDVKNKNGKQVKFEFVNVSEQFHRAKMDDNVKSLFRENEAKSGIMTHRNEVAMREILEKYMEFVNKYA